jgi:DNA-binding CsgD family transcriptional regulator
MLGDLCRHNKNPQRALEHHRRALDLVNEKRLAAFERARATAAIGMDMVVLGREAEGRVFLEDTVSVSRRWGLGGSLVPALLYIGWLDARSGREHEATCALDEAMNLAEEHEHIHFLSQEAQVAVPIMALCDRFEAGAFIREKVLPLLPSRLQAYFHQLAKGPVYPTDVLLGPPRRVRQAQQAVLVVSGEQLSPEAVEGVEALTEREREVLKMIAQGMPNKVIGAKLFITEKTVKTHANHVFRKLGVASRLQATLVFQSYQRAQRAQAGARR